MTPIQQMLLGVGTKKKTYIDDVFSTYLYDGGSGDKTITNNIDMTKGGMFWSKQRTATTYAGIWDTERGVTKRLRPDSTIEEATVSNLVKSFNNNGVTISSDGGTQIYDSGEKHVSWSFRKEKGFFDVVTWDGNGVSGREISHNLGCVPGLIILKATTNAYAMSDQHWQVYHRDMTIDQAIRLNTTDGTIGSDAFGGAKPTATNFTVGNNYTTNYNGASYVAYVFAGGESTAATARSIDCNGSGQKLSWAAHNDFHLDGDFTIEFWVYPREHSNEHMFAVGNYVAAEGILCYIYSGKLYIQTRDTSNNGTDNLITNDGPPLDQWTHVAVVKSGSTVSVYQNGTLENSFTHTDDFGSASNKEFYVGGSSNESGNLKISNFRLVKGTAIYTSSFRPPNEPLTSITNTKLLCCNNSSVTGSTVTPGTITDNGSVAASIDSPFDDPSGFVFGENGDQNIIKCGSYEGIGTSGHKVNIGWEPQWLLIKATSRTGSWLMVDSMRGVVTAGNEPFLKIEEEHSENAGYDIIDFTPTGFTIKVTGSAWNSTNEKYAFIAIRRPDGYVGKPANAATDVFNVTLGNSSSTIPSLPSAFPVDFCLYKDLGNANWGVTSRLTGTDYWQTNTTSGASSTSEHQWDSHIGCHAGSWLTSNDVGYLWKRSAGFDVVTYIGNDTNGRQIPHSLGRTPEMIWIKQRTGSYNWEVYHKGLNGGTNPEQYYIQLDQEALDVDSNTRWWDTAPTSSHFTIGSHANVNNGPQNFLAMLFASVDGISKVGYFTGSSSDVTITTGFQPRFVIIKSTSHTYPWMVLDSVRGWGTSDDSGDDPYIRLNLANAAVNFDNGYRTSTGFVVDAGSAFVNNGSSSTYIYYAHA